MQDKFRIKLGFLSTRRNVFDPKEAGKYKTSIESHIRNNYPDVEMVTLDALNSEGLIFDVVDAPAAAAIMTQAGVDAVFAPHCNFGTEDAVAKAGKLIGKPLLLWGPRDEGPDENGFRKRDSQCGLFATSKALLRYGVPFSYITNSHVDSDSFRRGFEDFLAVASVIKNFQHLRIGQIGPRPAPFLSTSVNEPELLEKFGVEVVPTTLVEILKSAEDLMAKPDPEYTETLARLNQNFRDITDCSGSFEKTAGLKTAIRRWAAERHLDAIGIQCWRALQAAFGHYPCFVNGLLTDEGLPAACETDITGALSLLLLRAARRGAAPFLADLTIRHPTDDNVELLWHCGNFPPSLSKGANTVSRQIRNPFGCAGRWEVKGGDVTVAKMDGLAGRYQLLMGQAVGVEGPESAGTYLWARFDNWPKWERHFIYGPYIHHLGVVHGKCAHILYEACRYIPGLEPDPVYPTREMLEEMFIY
ncbi:MAG: fucose isomerase [Planctomycetes bacterium]|nr:fucose isomerase [Planctomycetota bacterium]